jgi:hypothetical protein
VVDLPVLDEALRDRAVGGLRVDLRTSTMPACSSPVSVASTTIASTVGGDWACVKKRAAGVS